MDAFEKNLNHMLVETFNNILKYEETSLKKILSVPVTISEAHMIEAIGAQQDDEMTIGKVASLLNIAMPTATIAVKKLERKGFIRKGASASDGRRAIVSLTADGRRINKVHQLFHEKMVRNLSGQFSEADRDILLATINKLNEFFKDRL